MTEVLNNKVKTLYYNLKKYEKFFLSVIVGVGMLLFQKIVGLLKTTIQVS